MRLVLVIVVLFTFLLCSVSLVVGTSSTYFPVGSSSLVVKNDNGINYLYHDRLGTDITTDTLPFGQVITEGDRFGFTGKELDDGGLHYFSARYMDSGIGRFTSIDPVQSNPAYHYTHNNPLNRVDPTGMSDPETIPNQYSIGSLNDPALNDGVNVQFNRQKLGIADDVPIVTIHGSDLPGYDFKIPDAEGKFSYVSAEEAAERIKAVLPAGTKEVCVNSCYGSVKKSQTLSGALDMTVHADVSGSKLFINKRTGTINRGIKSAINLAGGKKMNYVKPMGGAVMRAVRSPLVRTAGLTMYAAAGPLADGYDVAQGYANPTPFLEQGGDGLQYFNMNRRNYHEFFLTEVAGNQNVNPHTGGGLLMPLLSTFGQIASDFAQGVGAMARVSYESNKQGLSSR